eukprot:Gregarina_sp_Poly_1__939@NODE_1226_length_4720_cov_71_108532_g834_i0_p1_GENE_NODE_1226_length_4720_cov_71_108532_g834_i0NODE_1226_length_4720_cov_71_108532_g834_i0_p1_ORF_typecomplete_len885_score93_70LRAT/PF04970_13/2_7e07LRAT/PF04970_13/1_5e07Peptidase_C97/PF05903_14/8e03Peptidase_C97/PF05903_14/0_0099_NODE_1226_length_4720_cov_71_108532_g834_i0222676
MGLGKEPRRLPQDQFLATILSKFVAENDKEECLLTSDSIIVDHFIPIVALPSCGLFAPVSFHSIELADLKDNNSGSARNHDIAQARTRRRDIFSNSAFIQRFLKIDRRRNRRTHRHTDTKQDASNVSPPVANTSEQEVPLEHSIFVVSVSLTRRTCSAVVQALSLINAELGTNCRIPAGVGGEESHNSVPTAGTFSLWSLTLAKHAEQLSSDFANAFFNFFGYGMNSNSKATRSQSPRNASTVSSLRSFSVDELPETETANDKRSTSAASRTATLSPTPDRKGALRSCPAPKQKIPLPPLCLTSDANALRVPNAPITERSLTSTQTNLPREQQKINLDVTPSRLRAMHLQPEVSRTTLHHSANPVSNSAEGFMTRNGDVFVRPVALSDWLDCQHVARDMTPRPAHSTSTAPGLKSSRSRGWLFSSNAAPTSSPATRSSSRLRKSRWSFLSLFSRRQRRVSLASQSSSQRPVVVRHKRSGSLDSAIFAQKRKARLTPNTTGVPPNRRTLPSRPKGHSNSRLSSSESAGSESPLPLNSERPLDNAELDQAFFMLISIASLFAHAHTQGSLCCVVEMNLGSSNKDEDLRSSKADKIAVEKYSAALSSLEKLFSIWLCNYTDERHSTFPCVVSRSDITNRLKNSYIRPVKMIIPPVPLERGTHIYREIRSAGGLSMMTHHGLYVGGGDVIHFSGNEFALKALLFPDQQNTKLRRTSIMTFMKFGGKLVIERYERAQNSAMNDGQKALVTRVVSTSEIGAENLASVTYCRTGILFPTGVPNTTQGKAWYAQALSNEGAALRAEFAYAYFHWARSKQQDRLDAIDTDLCLLFESLEGRFKFPPYNLFSNNCEHFCRWCKTGAGISLQVNFIGRALEAFFRGLSSPSTALS